MQQAHVYFALIRLREGERPEAARQAEARRYRRGRTTATRRTTPVSKPE